VMYACCSEPPPDPRSVCAEVPEACAAIVLKAMAKEPSDRYANAQAMLADLLSLLEVPRLPSGMSAPVAAASLNMLVAITPARRESHLLRGYDRFWRSPWVVLPVLVAIAVSAAVWAWGRWGDGDRKAAAHASSRPDAAATSSDGWTPLFNRQDLAGWWKLKSPPGEWVVEDGILVGRMPGPARDPSSYLLTDRDDYANFECRAEVRISQAGNSGIFFRCNSDSSLPQGLEAHIGTVECGDLHRTWAHSQLPQKVSENPIAVPPNRWFTLEISARGPQVVIRVNGVTTADVTEHSAAPARGYLALQVFDPGTEVAIRKLEIRELP